MCDGLLFELSPSPGPKCCYLGLPRPLQATVHICGVVKQLSGSEFGSLTGISSVWLRLTAEFIDCYVFTNCWMSAQAVSWLNAMNSRPAKEVLDVMSSLLGPRISSVLARSPSV